jgi:predicted unusual protein kinase regulating ubiquinone biosynthesis (AarF/ABC1/UbiB family)
MKELFLFINILYQVILYIFKYSDYENTIINILKWIGNYNIIFIKIFQWIWLKKNNFLTEKIINYIQLYSNNTPYDESDIDYKSLLQIYKIAHENSDKFEMTSLYPINSGSISIVFDGKLNDKNIIIKILKKNVKQKIINGLNFIISLENILVKIPFINYYNKIFTNNKQNILNQINFVDESENIMLFYKKFKNKNNILIPLVYSNYTIKNNNVILMDYLKGKYLYQLDKNELNNFFDPFFQFLTFSIFKKKIYHSDLHYGNILFDTVIENEIITYKIGVIDFGMIMKLSINEVNFMYIQLTSIFNNDLKSLLNYMNKIKNDIFIEYSNFNKCCEELNKLNNEIELFKYLTPEFLTRDIHLFLKLFNKHNCILSPRYNFFILSLIPIFTIFNELGKNIDTKKIMIEKLNSLINNELLD